VFDRKVTGTRHFWYTTTSMVFIKFNNFMFQVTPCLLLDVADFLKEALNRCIKLLWKLWVDFLMKQ
jgi:hypothetical protein